MITNNAEGKHKVNPVASWVFLVTVLGVGNCVKIFEGSYIFEQLLASSLGCGMDEAGRNRKQGNS